MEKQKCPEVRFKGFDQDWGAKSLSELGAIQTGSTPSTTEDSNYSKLGLLWVTPTDINSQLILNSGKKLSIIGREKARIVPANTILVTCIASIGKNGLLQEEASFNQQINSLTPYVGNDPYFLLSQSYFWSERMKQFAAKGTMQIVNKTQFSNIQTFIPELAEQTQIGNFFQNLDQSIALQEKKLAQTQNLKKAMLEKMFPKAGSKQPEIRLKGFSGDWEQYRLGGLCSEFCSGEFIKAENIASSGDYPVYGGNGLRGYADIYNHDGDFALIGRQGALCGNMQFSCGKAFFTEHAVAVKANNSNNTSFLYHLLGTMNLGQYSGQSAQPGLAVGNLIEIETLVPCKTEQIQIGQFFKQLDQTITLHQQQLQTLKNLKQAFLEKMFV